MARVTVCSKGVADECFPNPGSDGEPRTRGYASGSLGERLRLRCSHACYRDLRSIPGGVEGVVIGTRPEIAEETMRECAELGIERAWMHRSFGTGSVSEVATDYGRERGIEVIDGGCPLMFEPTADLGHKVMRFILTLNGNVPKTV